MMLDGIGIVNVTVETKKILEKMQLIVVAQFPVDVGKSKHSLKRPKIQFMSIQSIMSLMEYLIGVLIKKIAIIVAMELEGLLST